MSVDLTKMNFTYSQDPESIDSGSGVNWKAVATVIALTVFMVVAFFVVGFVFSNSKKPAGQAQLGHKTVAVQNHHLTPATK